MIFVVKSYKKINNKSVFSAPPPLRKKTRIIVLARYRSLKTSSSSSFLSLLFFYARGACVTVVCRERGDFDEECLFFFSSLRVQHKSFFKIFLNFTSLLLFWRERRSGTQTAQTLNDAIHIESGLPRSFVFRAFPCGFGQLHEKEYLRERERESERQKRAVCCLRRDR